jgi:hypothetical protein
MTPERDTGFVDKLPDENLECRVQRHHFKILYWGKASGIPDFKSKFGSSIIVKQAQCVNCGALKERHQRQPCGDGTCLHRFPQPYPIPR